MPVYLNTRDVVSDLKGLRSVLIVPCKMCPGISMSVQGDEPFMEFFKSFLKLPSLEREIRTLQAGLRERGVNAGVFASPLPYHFFVCIWTAGRRRKLLKRARQYEAVIVMGCDSATETIREALESTDCKVIQGMDVKGFMNVKPRLSLTGSLSFKDCRIIPISPQKKEEVASGSDTN